MINNNLILTNIRSYNTALKGWLFSGVFNVKAKISNVEVENITTTMKPITTIATSNNNNNHRTNFVITVKIHNGIENANVVEKHDDLVLIFLLSMFYE